MDYENCKHKWKEYEDTITMQKCTKCKMVQKKDENME